jgi:anhydro-N-acetylmuramic acid kinase
LPGLTVQLGDGAAGGASASMSFMICAPRHGLGGQGAPLVPAYHRALAAGFTGEWAG